MTEEKKVSLCSKCDDEIVWIKYNDRPHPVNAKALQVFVKKEDGTMGIKKGYVSHFATCPYAEEFRTKKKQ